MLHSQSWIRCIAAIILAIGFLYATAQENKPEREKIYVPLGGWTTLGMKSKGRITNCQVHKSGIITADVKGDEPVRVYEFTSEGKPTYVHYVRVGGGETINDQRVVSVTGKAIGQTRVDFTDVDGKRESYDVEVRRERRLPSAAEYRLFSPIGRALQKAVSANEKCATIAISSDDPKHVLIKTLEPAETTLQLTDTNGKSESVILRVLKPTLTIIVGEKTLLQRKDKEAIRTVDFDSDSMGKVVKLIPTDPRTVEAEGIWPGLTIVKLEADKRETETHVIGVVQKK